MAAPTKADMVLGVVRYSGREGVTVADIVESLRAGGESIHPGTAYRALWRAERDGRVHRSRGFWPHRWFWSGKR